MKNRLVGADVEFEFEVDQQPDFEFMGAECFQWKLSGGEELIVPLQVVFSNYGLYNLQSVRLTVFSKDSGPSSSSTKKRNEFLFPFQWILKVSPFKSSNQE